MEYAFSRDLIRAEPFVPFRLTLKDGNQFTIRDRALVMLLRHELYVVEPDDNDELPDFGRKVPYATVDACDVLPELEPIVS